MTQKNILETGISMSPCLLLFVRSQNHLRISLCIFKSLCTFLCLPVFRIKLLFLLQDLLIFCAQFLHLRDLLALQFSEGFFCSLVQRDFLSVRLQKFLTVTRFPILDIDLSCPAVLDNLRLQLFDF